MAERKSVNTRVPRSGLRLRPPPLPLALELNHALEAARVRIIQKDVGLYLGERQSKYLREDL